MGGNSYCLLCCLLCLSLNGEVTIWNELGMMTWKHFRPLTSHPLTLHPTGSFWDPLSSQTLCLGTPGGPVTKMVPVAGKLWCGCQNRVLIINTSTLVQEVRPWNPAEREVVGWVLEPSTVVKWLDSNHSLILFQSGRETQEHR